MSYDPRWHDAAKQWLEDCELGLDTKAVDHDNRRLAEFRGK